ncbi:hypothetical protein HY990_05465 [Candidatus Micrarchaeota archaeon]|nr:hypothetical protein [Candidatus Micrarchaeota archaeon]
MEESEEVVMPQMQQGPRPQGFIPPALAALMYSAFGESLILLGGLFLIVGFAAFLGSIIGIKGSGEMLVGILLLLGGLTLVKTSKLVIRQIPNPQPPVPPVQMIPPKQDPPSGYR